MTAEHWGTRLKRLRSEQGLSQQELADKAGLSKARVSQIEQGDNTNATLTALLGLQKALNLDTIEALLGDPPSATLAPSAVGLPRPR